MNSIDPTNGSSDNHSSNTEPKDVNKRRRLSCGLSAFLVSALLVALAIIVINPMLRPPVDPDASGPNLSKSSGDNEDASAMRDSITDQLFMESEVEPEHPLDPALSVARQGLKKIRDEVKDYTALLVKQERVKGKLLPEEFMRIKVRHPDKEKNVAKSFYIRHVSPEAMSGQEAIWVDGSNDNKIRAHGAGLQKLVTVNPKPDSWLAMRGNRYPITELGIETLILRMIEKGERDRQHKDECTVEVSRDIQFDGHPCTMITITHPKEIEPFEFHVAKIYIDDKMQLPVGYEGFLWPEPGATEPVLVERYFYRELEINVGLKDKDFDPSNPDYEFR